tara:strand:- start:1419 stop:1760 length:342 start_codon:yes stop_codon:yes gene_type:complete
MDEIDNDSLDNICTICIETLENNQVIEIECGHVFHKQCLYQYIESLPDKKEFFCPNCRKEYVLNVEESDCEEDYNPVLIRRRPNRVDFTWYLIKYSVLTYFVFYVSFEVYQTS